MSTSVHAFVARIVSNPLSFRLAALALALVAFIAPTGPIGGGGGV